MNQEKKTCICDNPCKRQPYCSCGCHHQPSKPVDWEEMIRDAFWFPGRQALDFDEHDSVIGYREAMSIATKLIAKARKEGEEKGLDRGRQAFIDAINSARSVCDVVNGNHECHDSIVEDLEARLKSMG